MRALRPFPGFKVAAHGVFVARFLDCSCSSFAFPGSNSCWLSVKWVNFFLTWTHSVWYDVVCFLLGYWHDVGWKCISVNDICPESSGNCSLETQSRKLRVVSHLYFMTSHRCQPWSTSKSLSLWPGTSWSFEDERFRDKHQLGTQFHRRWGSEGLLCPGIPSGCSWCLCRQFVERLCSLLVLILRISRFQLLLTVSEVGEFLFDLNSFCVVWCGMLSTGIVAWYWLEMYLSKRHLPWFLDPVGFVLWKLRVGNWVLCLICISWRLTDVNLDLLPSRFPFGQALAEALKTNTSVTRIYLRDNPIGDEGVKAFCVPGFQVAAHGASAYSWCWGSDSDPDWRVLRVLRASAVGDVIVPSSTAHSQALKQVIEEKKKMDFELHIYF